MFQRWRLFAPSGLLAAAAGVLAGGAVFAAGTGYVPTAPIGVVTVPGAFVSVVTAITVTLQGISTNIQILSTTVQIVVTHNAFNQNVTMVATQPNLPTIAPGAAPAGLLNYYPIAGMGLGFQDNADQMAVPRGPVVVTMHNPRIRPGDRVIEYTRQHRWKVVPDVLRLRKGVATFYFRGDPDVAVVAPVQQFGYHVYGLKPLIQKDGQARWQPQKPVGPVFYRNLGTDPANPHDWLIAEMSHTGFRHHFATPVPWAIYPQSKAKGKVGPVHPLGFGPPAGGKNVVGKPGQSKHDASKQPHIGKKG